MTTNNNFANRITLSGNSGSSTSSNVGATSESGELLQSGTINSVWWSWIAPLSGNVIFDTIGSNFDTYLSVYTGNFISSLTSVADNDDIGNGNIASRVSLAVTAGTTYHIAVDGYNDSTGNITLNYSFTPNTLPSGNGLKAGDLDLSFGNGGKVLTDFGSNNDFGYSVALQPDGKFIVAGSTANGSTYNDFALARYNSNGTLDTTFGNGGKVITNLSSSSDYGRSVAIQSDGKIVVAGRAFNGSNDCFALTRYNRDGSLDTSFGNGGKVTTFVRTLDDEGMSVAIQADGKIVVAGASHSGSKFDFALTRYNNDGSLDSSFGTGGKVITPIGNVQDFSYSLAIQLDGKIVVAGSTLNSTTSNINDSNFALTRYNTNGSLDTNFGNGGKVITDFGSNYDSGHSVVIQSDGKIVVAGGANFGFGVARYNANGTLDSSFGSGGKVITPIIGSSTNSAGIESATIQSDGKIVVAGYAWNGSNKNFAVARYNVDGTLDNSFGSSGQVITPIGSRWSDDGGKSVVIQPDGNIVVAGGSNGDFALVRYIGATPNQTFNTAPTLSDTLVNLNSVNENAGIPSGQVGTLVSSLVSLGRNVSDRDSNAATGIAITTTNTTNGNWYYSTNNGTNWNLLGTVSNSSARLLAADVNTRIYFQPIDNFNGNINNAIVFRAWDRTSGSNGSIANTTTNGGITAYSSVTDTASITVTAVNRAPVATNDTYNLSANTSFSTAAATTTALILDDRAGGTYVGQGNYYNFTPATGNFSARRAYPTNSLSNNAIRISYDEQGIAGHWWSAEFAAPFNAPLTAGTTYTNAVRFPFQDNNQPGLSISGDGRGNNTLTGQFTINQILYSPDDTVSSLDATFEQKSPGDRGILRGQVKYNATPNNLLPGVLTNDTDAERTQLRATLVSGPLYGRLTFNPNGSFNYTPNSGFNGIDTFTYRASDGIADSNIATVTLNVGNQAPIVSPVITPNQSFRVNENAPVGTVVGTVVATDPDSTTFSNWTITGGNLDRDRDGQTAFSINPSSGQITVSDRDEIDFENNPSFQLQVTVSDSTTTSSAQNVTVNLNDISENTTNDNFANRILLSGNSGTSTGSNVASSGELGEPVQSGTTNSVWWSWIATSSGDVTFNTLGSSFDTYLSVYTGNSINSLTRVAANDDMGNGSLASRVTVAVTAGTTYQISVDGYESHTGNITLNYSFIPTPLSTNAAPTLTDTVVTLGSVNEDANVPEGTVGTLVSSLVSLGRNVTDSSSSSVTGIAITAANTTNGIWYYSTNNGVNWNVLGAVSNSNAHLLAADDISRLYFQPNANFNGNIANAITFRAWDRTSGSNGSTADTTTNGGTTAFSTATDTASIMVNAVNDAPVITLNQSFNVNENAPNGTIIGTVVATDPDGTTTFSQWRITDGNLDSDRDGQAAFSINPNSGQITVNDSNDLDFESNPSLQLQVTVSDRTTTSCVQNVTVNLNDVSENTTNDIFENRILLSGTNGRSTGTNVGSSGEFGEPTQSGTTNSVWWSWIAPSSGNVTFDTIDSPFDTFLSVYTGVTVNGLTRVAANDDMGNGSFASRVTFAVTAGTTYQISVDGYQSRTGNITLNYSFIPTPPIINAAPTLTDTIVTLGSVNEDANVPSGTVGTLVSSLVSLGRNVIDSNSGGLTGIAIAATNTTNGSWYYSTNNGVNWYSLGNVSDSSARLLAADANTRIYFQPNSNYNGTITNALTFRAWDQTSGTNGSTANINTNGGTTAFSTATDTASITINGINDAPVVTPSQSFGIQRNTSNGTIIGTVTATDIDSATFSNWTIAGGNIDRDRDGRAALSINSTTGAITINDIDDLDPQSNPSINLQVNVSDGITTSANETVTVKLGLKAGDLDPNFGNGGIIITPVGNRDYSRAESFAIQSDGKMVVAGFADIGSSIDFVLTRHNPNGTIDTSFGNGGIVRTPIGISSDYAKSIAIQTDGKIVVVGDTYDSGQNKIAIVRYNVNGSLDTSFGNGGKIVTNFDGGYSYGKSVAIQSDGKILVSGDTRYFTNNTYRADFGLIRYNQNGTVDNSFGNGGKVITDINVLEDTVSSIAIQSDGKILVVGNTRIGGTIVTNFSLVRYNPNGSLDTGFGSGGKVITSISNRSDYVHNVLIQPDGKIVLVGSANNSTSFALARYNTNGTLDTSFGNGGMVVTPSGTPIGVGVSAAIQSDGNIVVAGASGIDNDVDVTLLRYNSNGTLDSSFGSGGQVITDIGKAGAEGVAILPNGNIVVAGGDSGSFALVRYLGTANSNPVPLNVTYHQLATSDFSQDWSNSNLITTNDDWSRVSSIRGFRGDDLVSSPGTDPQLMIADGVRTPVNVYANQNNPSTFTSSGVAEFALSNPTVALGASSVANAPHLVLYLNATGRQNIRLSYTLRDIDTSTRNATQPVAVQYRIGNTGNFINLPTAFVPDASNSALSSYSYDTREARMSVVLPTEVNNQAQVQLRFITTDATGDDEWIGIDDIKVTSKAVSSNLGSWQLLVI